EGLTIEHIARMLAPLDTTLPRDARDAAMLLVAYETQLRRSNVVGLDLEHLTFDSDGTTAVLIKRSKEDQLGKGRIRNLSVETTKRLRHWIALAGITEGPVFRSLPHAAKADRFAQKRLSDRDVARIFKRRAAAVGLSSTEIAGHSTRIGAAQDMLAAGLSGAEIMREVGWRTERQLFRYTERLESKRGAMAKFLKLRAQKAPEAKEEESS
ncbi:MAG: site-specific integrase, partial [Terriglobia bacterium]|nr:site-specific integrase [Terriglobia bacterium]